MLEFLNGLDDDIRKAAIAQIRNLWTHGSTAIEGNTLTLGETAFVSEEGLTVSGKPLKDHQEVVGHARAIDLIYNMVQSSADVTESDLFQLHKAVQPPDGVDIYKPVGGWKKEPNGTYIVKGDKQVFYEYAAPDDVSNLMEHWINFLNSKTGSITNRDDAISAYADLHISFAWIHPFFDGNGRMARLVANIPVLKAGFPPIMISKLKRREYLLCLSHYALSVGSLDCQSSIITVNERLNQFRSFCKESWKESIDIVDEAHAEQMKRDNKKN